MSQYDELKRLAEAALRPGLRWMTEFTLATGPDVILALIAENERLQEAHEQICTNYNKVSYASEERGKQVDQLKAENERLRADYAGLARFNPEWDRVAAAQDLVREHMAMVVQLKAEIAGLKTGYEAYEQVNAELKAENERLERNRDMWKGQVERQIEMLRLAHEADKLLKAECEGLPKHAPSSEIIWCECGDGYPANSYGAGFMDANGGVCANCDAALGQGEQS